MKSLTLLAVLSVALVVSVSAFKTPTKAAPSSVLRKLFGASMKRTPSSASATAPLRHIPTTHVLPSDLKHVLLRQRGGGGRGNRTSMMMDDPTPDATPDMDDEDDYYHHDDYYYHHHYPCKPKYRNGHAIALAQDYYGPYAQAVYADRHHHFLRFAFGLTPSEIEESRDAALAYLKGHFGVTFKGSVFDPKSGFYYDPARNLSGGFVVFSEPLRMVADSFASVPCIDTTAVLGGWLVTGTDVLVGGELHPEGVMYKGEIAFFLPGLVFNVGTPQSTRIVLSPIYPLHCPHNGMCGLSGYFVNAETGSTGWYDGVSIDYVIPGYAYTSVTRLTMMSPGRFTPGLKDHV